MPRVRRLSARPTLASLLLRCLPPTSAPSPTRECRVKTESLVDVIADERGQAAVLRHKGFVREAEMIERFAERVARAAAPFIDWLSEKEAVLRSGHSADWHRARFAQLEAQGLARWNPERPRERQYLRCVVPQRANTSAARVAGLRGERLGA